MKEISEVVDKFREKQEEIERLRDLLCTAFDEGFTAGFHCEDNPGDSSEEWIKFKEKYL